MRILSAGVLLLICTSSSFAQNPTHLGEKAPPFRFGTFVNATVPYETLEDLEGDVVLLCWLRTACPGCRGIMPVLEKLRRDHDRSDFHVFAATNDSVELFWRFLVHEGVGRKFDVPTVVRSQANWGVTKLPWAYVIGRDGKVAWAGHPGQGVEKAVKAALAAADPAIPEAPRAFVKATSLLADRRYAKALVLAEKASASEATTAFGKWVVDRVARDAGRARETADAYRTRGDVSRACEVLEKATARFEDTPYEAELTEQFEKLKGDERCRSWRALRQIEEAARRGSPKKVSGKLRPLIASDDEKLVAAAKALLVILNTPWTIEDAATMGGLIK